MKSTIIHNERGNCIEKGMKIYEEVFLGVLVLGMGFLLFAWMNLDHLSLPALVQFLFVSSWIGIIGLVGAIAVVLIYSMLGKKLC